MSNIPSRICPTCNKSYDKPATCSKSAWYKGYKSCSLSCAAKRRGTAHLEKFNFKKGVQQNPATQFKPGQAVGEKNAKWKGDEASYVAKHMWIRHHYGKASQCEECGDESERMYHWSNKSGAYKRDITDWQQMCVPCHKKYDLEKLSVTKLQLITN